MLVMFAYFLNKSYRCVRNPCTFVSINILMFIIFGRQKNEDVCWKFFSRNVWSNYLSSYILTVLSYFFLSFALPKLFPNAKHHLKQTVMHEHLHGAINTFWSISMTVNKYMYIIAYLQILISNIRLYAV